MIHWPSSSRRCGSIRISHWPKVTTAWRSPIAGAGRRPLSPRNALCDAAKAALQELLRAQPNISLGWIAEQMPIQHEAEREHYLEGFRRAGLD